MNPGQADFIIVGSTPLARLVAGLLGGSHGKRVVFLGESQASYRLPRHLDLSVPPITRPESWALLNACQPEALKLISRAAGRQSWSRVNPILFADGAAGKEGLGHIRHMAQAFGHATERVGPASIAAGRDGVLVRDAVLLHAPAVETRLDRWLTQQQVDRAGDGDSLIVNADGSAELTAPDGDRTHIAQAVLADDDAIIAYLPPDQWPSLLLRRVCSTIATQPTRTIAASVMHSLDTGMSLVQQPGRGVTAMGPGAIDAFSAGLGLLLNPQKYQQAGQSSYQTLETQDFAPAFGRAMGRGADIFAGLGPGGAFLAPAIARWLSGTADALENSWFGARLVDRNPDSSAVAEFGIGR